MAQDREDFVGLWWVSHGDGAPLQLRLYPDGSAWSDYPANNPGTWSVHANRAQVIWADDWKEMLLQNGGGWEKYGFKPGEPFSSFPSNLSRAYRVTRSSDGWFGVKP